MSRPGIVVLGTPRSGTTLLRRLLDAHPNIACPPETYVLSGAARFLHEETFAQGLKIGTLSLQLVDTERLHRALNSAAFAAWEVDVAASRGAG